MASDADDLGLELIPADDEGSTPEDDLAAAVRSALADPEAPIPVEDDSTEPYGYTWAFDWSAGRFKRRGSSPAVVTGTDALIERCMMALNAARYAHPVFSDEFGVEDPQHGIGLAGQAAAEAADDWKVKTRDALMIFDDVTDVQVTPEYDAVEGGIFLRDLVVTTNEDVELSFPDIRVDLTET